MDEADVDICRVCRCEAGEQELFYPCICTGSIKYIHQDCLQQWMRYSRKEYCELCGHRFSFTPIYAPDMPRVLPLKDVASGLISSIGKAAGKWLHYTLVAFAWFGIVPLSAYRTYKFMFGGFSIDYFLGLQLTFVTYETLGSDLIRGCFVFTCTLLSFIGLIWLREQILHGGGPDWLDRNDNVIDAEVAQEEPARPAEDDAQEAEQVEEPIVENEEVPPQPAFIHNEEPPQRDPEEQQEQQQQQQQEDGDNAVNEENNWNPMEWDRAADEITWERLLGLDGSMVFLEHVFWVISLNTIFIFTFAFCPNCIGNFVINWLGLLRPDKPLLHFHGLIVTLFGYCNIGVTLIVLHYFARMFKMNKIRWLLGLCYIVVKVSLLSVIEIGFLPLICGWWLDICSLPMFDATLKDRQSSFRAAPSTSLFIHWMFGMVYVYYFAAFITLLREVLRPGVLWFLRNLNDPDFSPIQEMIHISILRHIRRLIASAMIFGTVVFLMLYIPIQILKKTWPTFLPYTLSGDSEVNEFSLQLLLLQIILPGFFEQSHTRVWLKGFLRLWCRVVSWILGIRNYLLGDPQQQNPEADQPNEPPNERRAANLAAAHRAIAHMEVPMGFQPYVQPSFFSLRLFGLMAFMCLSLTVCSLITLTVPVWLGRQVMALWAVSNHLSHAATPTTSEVQTRPHELYTTAVGTYLCWLISRGIAVAVNLIPQGRTAIMNKVKQWLQICASYALAAVIFVLLLGVIPLLFGLLLELVVVIPFRVPFNETPIHFLWHDWALGVLYTKIAVALTLMGPEWGFRRAIERAYRDGLRDIDLKFIIKDIAAPVITCFGLALSIPYVIAHSFMPMFFADKSTLVQISRQIYPFFLVVAIAIGNCFLQVRQFKKLYIAIKNDKYLIGQRLVNYDHRKKKQEEAAAAAAAKAEEDDLDPPGEGEGEEADELLRDELNIQEQILG